MAATATLEPNHQHDVASDRRLLMHEVYLVTTVDDESMIGAYAGTEDGCLVFDPGVLSPVWIPAAKVRSWRRLA